MCIIQYLLGYIATYEQDIKLSMFTSGFNYLNLPMSCCSRYYNVIVTKQTKLQNMQLISCLYSWKNASFNLLYTVKLRIKCDLSLSWLFRSIWEIIPPSWKLFFIWALGHHSFLVLLLCHWILLLNLFCWLPASLFVSKYRRDLELCP